MADKFLTLTANGQAEKELPVVSAGSSSAGLGFATGPDGKWDISLMPTGIGPASVSVLASESLVAGNNVDIWNNAGVSNVRKADGSTSGKSADGFVTDNVASGAMATIFLSGRVNAHLSGMTPGATQYLSTTVPGGVQETVPTGSGVTFQELGVAISETELAFQPKAPIRRA
jgi:hypothetical protein